MQVALTQGVIAKKKNIIPRRILICAFAISTETLVRLTTKIITGILKIIIIKLPIAKFFLFNKFIEADIDVMQVIIGDPIKKLKNIVLILTKSTFSKILEIGITTKKGI